jgi:hypothetical protein
MAGQEFDYRMFLVSMPVQTGTSGLPIVQSSGILCAVCPRSEADR